MKLNSWYKAVTATLLAQIIWGVAAPLVKIELDSIPPFSLVFLRSLFTVLVLFPFFEFKLHPLQPPLTSNDKKTIFLAGFTGVFLNLLFYFTGQQLTTVIDTFVIISAGTPLILIYSYFFEKERLNKLSYLGSLLAFIGTLTIIGSPILSFGSGSLLGNTLALFATISACASYIFIRRLMTKFDPLLLTFYFFLISLIFSLPLMLWEFLQNPYWMAGINNSNLIILAYLVLGSSISAYYLTNLGLKHLPASLSSTVGYVSTFIAVLLSITFLREKPTIFFLLGTLLIIAGLILAETRHRRKNQQLS